MQERARERALRRFTADFMVEATLAVYREAVSAYAVMSAGNRT